MNIVNFSSFQLLQIPYGNSAAIAAITAPATEDSFSHNYCGRFFSIAAAATAGVTVCSKCEIVIYFLRARALEGPSRTSNTKSVKRGVIEQSGY